MYKDQQKFVVCRDTTPTSLIEAKAGRLSRLPCVTFLTVRVRTFFAKMAKCKRDRELSKKYLIFTDFKTFTISF